MQRGLTAVPRFSVLIPARNEERFLPACLESVKAAAAPFPDQVEIIVALNRCTDGTEAIAVAHGASIVHRTGKTWRESGMPPHWLLTAM
jgi:glycosyltransferase involved in cell wall biosynthesis